MFIQAERFPPEMKKDVATAVQAYRRVTIKRETD